MIDLIVQAHIEDLRRELDMCLRGAEAVRFARLSAVPSGRWWSRLRPGQRTSRASSAAFAAGHSASSIE